MENILSIVSLNLAAWGFTLAMFVAIRQKRNDRLTFLADRIFDPYIPKEFKLPFYEEYISMKGNGTAVRFWQLEGEREKKMQRSA